MLVFENYNKDCVWRNNKGSTVVVLDTEEKDEGVELVTKVSRSTLTGGPDLCGALGLRCSEEICAPFYFINKTYIIAEESHQKFLEELT